MTRWAVIFKDHPDMMAIRADKSRRDAHVTYVKAHPELLIGGGLRPDAEADFSGALWIVELDSKAKVEALISADPFYLPELRSYEIFAWGKILEDQSAVL